MRHIVIQLIFTIKTYINDLNNLMIFENLSDFFCYIYILVLSTGNHPIYFREPETINFCNNSIISCCFYVFITKP